MAAGGGTRAVVTALVANLGIAIAKFVGFLVTRSSSLLAESIHSLADTGNQALLLLGGKQAARAPSEEHAFGYGRERYFWSFVVAIVLFTLGGGFATYEGIEKIRHPHEIESLGWAYGILIFAIGAEFYAFSTAVREANKVRHGRGWIQFIRESRVPELPVVLLEDSAAMIGLIVALGAVTVSQATGDPVWDGVGTLTIGIILFVVAVVLAIEMKSLLIGESATGENRTAIRAAIDASPSVTRIIDLKTQHLGPEDLLVAAKIEFDRSLDNAGVAAAIDELEGRVRAAVPISHHMYIEPDIFRSDG